MPFRALISAFFALLLYLPAWAAQKDSLATLRGLVTMEVEGSDRVLAVGVSGAVVQLFYLNGENVDSLYTTTNKSGEFIFRNIAPQRIGITIRNMGFKTIMGAYDIGAGENMFLFSMQEQVEELSGASISAEIPLIRQIQDTTVYNAKAIKTLKDSDLRQLLEMLPGFEVSENAITVDGRPVNRTYVNGKLVFGDKVTTALDALRADEVSEVKVYDELSDIDKHRGVRNARKNRVLDIVTKDSFISIAKASAAVSGGADQTGQIRYATAGVLEFHSEMFQAEALLDCSNIKGLNDNQALSTLASSLVSQRGPLGAYKETQYLLAQGTKYWNDRFYGNSASFMYEFSHENSRNTTTALNEYFGIEGTPAMVMNDTTTNSSGVFKHRGSLKLNMKDTPLKSFSVELGGTIGTNKHDAFYGNLTQIEGLSEQRTHQNSGSDDKDYSALMSINWTNNDAKQWRPFLLLSASVTDKSHISWIVDTLNTSYLKRSLSSDGIGRGSHAWFQAGLETILANTSEKTEMIRLRLNSQYDHYVHRQLSYDELAVDVPIMNIANSYDYTYNQLQNYLEAEFNLSTSSGRSLLATASIIDAILFDDERLPADYHNKKHYPSIGSKIFYNSPRLSLTASSSSVTPSIEQIRNRISDTNPLVLTAGNPNLKQGYTISISTDYNPPVKPNGSGRNASFAFSVTGGIVINPIVSNVRYFDQTTVLSEYDGYTAHAGSLLNTFDNSKIPRINISGKVSYTKNIVRHGLKLGFSLSDNHMQSPMYYGGLLSPVDENGIQVSLTQSYVPSRRISIKNRFSISHIVSSRQRGILSERVLFNDTFSMRWFVTEWLRWDVQYSLYAHNYLSGTGQNHSHNILNTGLSAPLGQLFELGIWGYDIINSGSLYTTKVTSASMSQTWTPTYGRNIMLKLAYRLKVKR